VYAHEVARAVANDRTGKTKGVLICGTGTGMSIAANRHKGVRAALAYDAYSARMARHDNDANVVCLRGRQFPASKAANLALAFLKAPFSGIPRHARRIKKLDNEGSR
jgi:ribose 5-phosphate isomerase B